MRKSGKSGKSGRSAYSVRGSKKLRASKRVRASDIRRGDSLIFRGADNRRVRFVENFYGSVNAPAQVALGIANADGTAFELRHYSPNDRVMIAR